MPKIQIKYQYTCISKKAVTYFKTLLMCQSRNHLSDCMYVFLELHDFRLTDVMFWFYSVTPPVVVVWSGGSSCVSASAEESSRSLMKTLVEATKSLRRKTRASRGRASNGTPRPGLRWTRSAHTHSFNMENGSYVGVWKFSSYTLKETVF